jgi:hypothetical protein
MNPNSALTTTCAKTSRLFIKTVFTLLLITAYSSAHSHDLSPQELQKIPEQIFEQIRDGKEKNLLVELDADEIMEALEAKEKERGLNSFDADLNKEMMDESKVLKDSIFPGGRLADATVLHEFTNQVYVRVPNMRSLELILRDPRVKRIYYIDPEKKLVETKKLTYREEIIPNTFAFDKNIIIGPIRRAYIKNKGNPRFGFKEIYVIHTLEELDNFNGSIEKKMRSSFNSLRSTAIF